MTSARLRALLPVLAALVAAAALAFSINSHKENPIAPRPPDQRPVLLLLTSLPILFNEQFSLQGGGSPALKALQTRYHVVPIRKNSRRAACCSWRIRSPSQRRIWWPSTIG